jgi:radical SAM protein with 4Fe4S-binding SPASM domain
MSRDPPTLPGIGARPRSLPVAPADETPRVRLPLAAHAREIDGAWRPVYAVWEVTLRCDLACRHCASRAGRARPDELTTAEALDLVSQMVELGVREVTLIGGEAYLRDDWTEIVRAIKAAGLVCSVTTGARGLTAPLARAARDAGLDAVSVSIDGLEDTHDTLRASRGSFEAAMTALAHLSREGVRTAANTQLSRPALHEMPELFERLVAAGIQAWQVQLTVPMGRAADEPHLVLEPYQVLELMPMLARAVERARAVGVRIWPGNNVGYFGPHEAVLRPAGHSTGCGAGRTTLGIEANGDIKGCPSLPTAQYVGGNVREHRLRDIWERTAPLRFTRDRTADELWGYCQGCYYAETCLGGCSWTAHTLFGRRGNNPFCHHRALELLREGKRERLIRTAPAGGRPFDLARFEILLERFPEAELERARELVATGIGWLADSPSSRRS